MKIFESNDTKKNLQSQVKNQLLDIDKQMANRTLYEKEITRLDNPPLFSMRNVFKFIAPKSYERFRKDRVDKLQEKIIQANEQEKAARALYTASKVKLDKLKDLYKDYNDGKVVSHQLKSGIDTQKHVRQTHMDAAQSKQLVQKAEPLFQQIYKEAFKIYEARVARQKDGSSPIPPTPEEKILLSQRELVGAVIAHMNHPSSSTQATLERRYAGYVEVTQKVQSHEALPFQKETHELLVEAKRLDPELKMDVKTHASAFDKSKDQVAAAWSHGSSDNRPPSPSSVSEIQEQYPKSGL
jgi:hypothetical protein